MTRGAIVVPVWALFVMVGLWLVMDLVAFSVGWHIAPPEKIVHDLIHGLVFSGAVWLAAGRRERHPTDTRDE